MSDKKEDNECGTYDCETCPNLACGGVPASIPKDSGKQLERGEIRIECPFCHNIEIEEGMWVREEGHGAKFVPDLQATSILGHSCLISEAPEKPTGQMKAQLRGGVGHE